MIFAYRIIINIIYILSPLIIIYRLFKKKEDLIRLKEKFCFFSKKKTTGKLIWIHGASVGEILSVIPLVQKLEKNKEIKQILITSNTLSSSGILSTLKLKKTIHQFFPIDTVYNCNKFLKYWRPSVVIFVDSEIWPNMLTDIKKRSIPLILLNARITKKSFGRWSKFSSVSKNLFSKFDICLTSNKQSKKFLAKLGAKNIKHIGNLKFAQSEKNKFSLSNDLKKNLHSRKIWCASSTHEGEEKFCAEVHKKLKKKYNNLLTIIIPRHVERVKKINDKMQELNLNTHIHSSKNKMDKSTDIYLVDTYGKTKSFFKVCKIVFLGGSLIKHGGQNPLEAARYGSRILHGPNISNFKEIYDLLNKYKISNKIKNINQMKSIIQYLLNHKTNSKNVKAKISNLGNKILKNTFKEIYLFIKKK
jgi:3-deoxy-D-manno-octulosonic-acid transferase